MKLHIFHSSLRQKGGEKVRKAFQRGFLSEGFSKLYCCTANVSQVSLPIIFGIFMNKRSNMTSVHKMKKTDRSML